MTNHWADIANATAVVIMGANPSENHPASMAHVNAARAGGKGHAQAKLIVVDPRKNRTALQADTYVRIRPGTDIAFINGVVKYIIDWMEAPANAADPKSVNFFAYLNQTGNGTFFTDGDATTGSTNTTPVPFNSKYTDARFIVNSNAFGTSDYVRETVVAATGLPVVGGEAANTIISNFPKKATSVTADPNTVYNRLKAHVLPYTQAVVADICGCTAADVATVAMAFIDNSRHASYNPATPTTTVTQPSSQYFRSTTMMYAMGLTQHTCGAQNVKSFQVLQSLMGNVGRCGGGINALRGIHNVQGSTDMGVLYGNIPAYSGNPSTPTSVDANAFGKYMDNLWGLPLNGTGGRGTMNNSYDDAYLTTNTTTQALQQRGFYNMTLKWFGQPNGMAGTSADRALVNAVYDLWPKGNGDEHRLMFRKMISGATKALICWGQNPAVTEPNQSAIRRGLRNLDLLVVTDVFENETAACDRKDGSVTYLIPAAAHVEHAGSSANSGRTLQWRYQSRKPAGNSKADIEILMRLAYALDQANAFDHIETAWTGLVTYNSVYDELYGTPYADGWDPNSATAFENVAGRAEVVLPTGNAKLTDGNPDGLYPVTGTEWVAEKVFREMCSATVQAFPAIGGTIWIYTNAYQTNLTVNKHLGQANWVTANRAKSRDRSDPNNTYAYPGWGYAWLVNRRVLYNNNATNPGGAGDEVPGDVQDFFMGPDSCARLYVTTSTLTGRTLNYSRWYRFYHRLSDVPTISGNVTPAFHVLPGRFPAHTEPYESPRADWETWGKNSTGTYLNLLPTVAETTPVGGPGTYPLVLTTIRCVEHFQGGPITRNNGLNSEIEPEPWIELNSADALKYGIRDGDWVNVITARSNSTSDQIGRVNPTPPSGNNSPAALDNFGKGFRARVGAGLSKDQRVAPGVVAIPWHWGERGLSNGSRANDLCIDAGDANTQIPESKACLCRIVKA